ncbi:MAG: EsaB/YukD family protein [Arachnia sp.]
MEYTRVTVHGSSRRSDLVLPNDDPLLEILPYVLDLLEEDPADAHTMRLTSVQGDQLDPQRTLGEQDVPDGALLHLVAADQAPPAPEVSDVTEAIVGERDRRGDVFNQTWARRLVLATAAILGWQASRLTVELYPDPTAISVAAAAVLIALTTRWRDGWVSQALSTTVIGAAMGTGAWFAQSLDWLSAYPRTEIAILGALACGGAATAVMLGWGGRRRAIALGATAGTIAALAPMGLIASGMSVAHTSVVTVAGETLVIGLLPALALTMSGLTGLDDQIVAGARARRERAAILARDAFATLGWLVVGIAVPMTLSLVALAQVPGPWATLLSVLVGIVLASRARFFPLVEQVSALWLSVAVLGFTLAVVWVPDPLSRAAICLGVAVGLILLLATHPADHARARWRGWLNVVEQLSVIAIVPALLGYFGIFTDLLETFRR